MKAGLAGQAPKLRRLQTTPTSEQIPNPVYCLQKGDNFMFTIDNPANYPVYMKDSVMNSNTEFDYGAFKDLETEMKRKISNKDTKGTIFTFTF